MKNALENSWKKKEKIKKNKTVCTTSTASSGTLGTSFVYASVGGGTPRDDTKIRTFINVNREPREVFRIRTNRSPSGEHCSQVEGESGGYDREKERERDRNEGRRDVEKRRRKRGESAVETRVFVRRSPRGAARSRFLRSAVSRTWPLSSVRTNPFWGFLPVRRTHRPRSSPGERDKERSINDIVMYARAPHTLAH